MAAEMTSSPVPSNQVIVLLGPGYGAVPVTQVVPTQGAVSYGNYVLCQPSFTHLQLPMQPITSMTTSTGSGWIRSPSPCGNMVPTPRTDVPSDSEEECNQSRRSTKIPPMPSASTARRLRRKRAAERAKVANASAAPQVSLEELRSQLRDDPLAAVQSMKGRIWPWSRNEKGCRLVQEALECLGAREAQQIAKELEGHVLEAATCPHANYVLQKVVSHLSIASSSFVSSELRGSVVRVAKHRFACRILCRLLEFCPFSVTSALVDELLVDVGELCVHNFAHHVMESILENGEERHKKLLAATLLVDPRKYATNKNSSYLVEKLLSYCSPTEQDVLIAKLGQPEMILDLALTQFGCYVARALLRDERVNATLAMQLILENQSNLDATPHGQRFLVDVGVIQPYPVGSMSGT